MLNMTLNNNFNKNSNDIICFFYHTIVFLNLFNFQTIVKKIFTKHLSIVV